MLKIGPAGLGPVKNSINQLDNYHKAGFRACEIAFTYGTYIKNDPDAENIGKHAKKLGIDLSIHAPYFVNLNSDDEKKREASRARIIDCCRVGNLLGAKTVVFHPGYYTEDRKASYVRVASEIKKMLAEVSKKGWNIDLAPETMGKVNVFGSVEEISSLVNEVGCSACIDFAHILARDKSVDYDKVKKLFPQKKWHVHFSGIEYGEKGEKNHKSTEKKEWETLLKNLPKDKEIVIVNESPSMFDDCVQGLVIAKKLGF